MKVYLAYKDVKYEGREVLGVFSSREKAIEFIASTYGSLKDGMAYTRLGDQVYVVEEEVK